MNTLASKISKASRIVGALATDKTNTAQNYSYISADKILNRCGDALSEVGVTVSPSIVNDEVAQVDYTDSYGKNKSRFDALVRFDMLVSDDENDMHLSWVGRGNDFSVPDKALYKAITSGHKYFLMKLLNVGVGNEDGEHEVVEEARPTTVVRKVDTRTGEIKSPIDNPFDDPYRADPARASVEFANVKKEATPAPVQPTYAYLWQKLSGPDYDLVNWVQAMHRKGGPCSPEQYGFLSGIMDDLTNDNHNYILSLLCQADISHENVPSKQAAHNLLNYLNPKDNPNFDANIAARVRQLGTPLPIPA